MAKDIKVEEVEIDINLFPPSERAAEQEARDKQKKEKK